MLLKFYAAFLVAYFTLYFFGYSLKVLFLNGDLKKYDLYITPWLGMGLTVMVLFPLSWLGYSVESTVGCFAAAVAALNFAVWRCFREGARFEKREVVFMVAIGAAVGSVYGAILFARDFDCFAVCRTGDYASYLNAARAVLASSADYMASAPEGVPHAAIIDWTLSYKFRGCIFVQALFSALYHVDLARVSYIISAFVMFLNIAMFRLFLKNGGYGAMAVLLVGILPFNTFYQGFVFMAFTGQLYSFGIVTLAFFIECHLAGRDKFDPKTCVLLVFILTFNGLNYIEAMAYPLVSAAAVLIVPFINNNYDKKTVLRNAMFAGCLWGVLNIPVISRFLEVVSDIDANPPAWFMHMPTFMDITGLYGAVRSPEGFLALLAVSNAVIVSVIAYQLRREGVRSFLSLTFAAYLSLHLFFCLKYFKVGEVTSYNVYKSALSLSFIAVVILLRFLEDRLNRFAADVNMKKPWGNRAGLGTVVVFAAVFSLNARASWIDLNAFPISTETAMTRYHDTIKHYAQSSSYAGSDFIVSSDSPLLQLYAMYNTPLGRTYTTDYGGNTGNSWRVMKSSFKNGDIYIVSAKYDAVFATTDAPQVFANPAYNIFTLEEGSIVQYDYHGLSHFASEGRIGGEPALIRTLASNKISLEYMVMKDKSIGFSMKFYDFSPDNRKMTVRAYANRELIGEFAFIGRRADVRLADIALSPGVNDIRLEFDGDVSRTALTGLEFL
jgi:hypothetical protein